MGVGVVVWLASELMFFSGLFAAWFTLRAHNDPWPPEGAELDVPRTAIATVVLLASSGTMHVATSRAKSGNRRHAVLWLGITAALGALFLTNQVIEYVELDFGLDSHAYGSIFYLLTGFHGLHVLGGLFFMGAVAAAIAGRSLAPAASTVEVCAAYWHFVDVVWIGVFSAVYLIS